MITRCPFFSLIFLVFAAACFACSQPVTIVLQPLGKVDARIIQTAREGILSLYRVKVLVLEPADLPPEAYYSPNKRYRAEKLLSFLDRTADKRYTKIVGLTSVDISTDKGDIPDWGIFGLGSLGGRCCVISTFRLRHGNPSPGLFHERIVRVVNHEIGHTFGLDHCPNYGCSMEDARGTIITVDREKGLCSECRTRLKKFIQE